MNAKKISAAESNALAINAQIKILENRRIYTPASKRDALNKRIAKLRAARNVAISR